MPIRRKTILRDRFIVIGVSRSLAADLASTVSRWESGSGQEWTVNRLKLLKAAFLKRIAGEEYLLPYVATRRDALGVLPKGPFGTLWKVTNTDMTSISRALNAMMVYSTFMADVVTDKQWEKFHNSMTRLPVESSAVKTVLEKIRIPSWMKVDRKKRLTSFEEFVVTRGYSVAKVNKELDSFVESGTGMALWSEFPQYKAVFQSEISHAIDNRIGMDDYFGYHPPLDSATTIDPVGILGCSQEPGYKLRVFASPNIVHQVAMSRLKAQLFTLLAECRWDCTYDQVRGTSWTQMQLLQGREVFSIDLSDATNNFPLEVQLHVLQNIGCLAEDVELFHRLSRAPWKSSIHGSFVGRWSVGQPLGLGPSFAAFALTHGVLVHSIARRLRVNDSFRVLGDDIVISDRQVATSYLEAMQKLGVPISQDKTIRSAHFAEFAGKVISRDGILNVLKWRDPSDRSFLDVVRLLGPRSVALLSSRQKRVATFVSLLPQPQGFGWNPRGVSLEKRLLLQQALNELTEEEERSYYPLQRRWNRIRSRLEQPYLSMRFDSGYLESDPVAGKAAENHARLPRPVGGLDHQLSISEMTGCPVRLPTRLIRPADLKRLRKMGFATATSADDPRGLNPLVSLERKIAKLRTTIDQLGLSDQVFR